jgi:hypothetical protein
MSEGRGPGEGPAPGPGEGGNPAERTGNDDYKSPGAQRENSQKEAGDPKEKQAEAERINREEGRHRGGFPVAGHGERDDSGRERSRSRR